MKKLLLLLTILPIIAPAQSLENLESYYRNEARRKNEIHNKRILSESQVTPNQELYDVNYYYLNLEVFPEEKMINCKTLIHAHVLSDLANIELDFWSFHKVHGVYLADYPDVSLEFLNQSGKIDIQLDKTYTKGEEVKILVDYSGGEVPWGLEFMKYKDLDMIFSWEARRWFPCKDTPGDKADSIDMRVTVPRDLVVASNGILNEVSHTESTSTYFWQERFPIATFFMSFAAYPYDVHTDWYVRANNDSMEILMFSIPEVYDQVKELYAKEKDMLAFYEENFGPYPFFQEKYGHAEINFTNSKESQTLANFGLDLLLNEIGESHIAHEMAHSWMANSVTNKSFHHIWIIEGFAVYAATMWYEFKEYEENILNSIMKIFEYYGPGTPYVENPEAENIYDTNLTYNKSAWIFHMLRYVVGDSAFFNIIKKTNSDPSCAYGYITTDSFREICESVSGLNLEKFFQQWVMGEYYPDYSYTWASTEKENGYELELILHQVQKGQLFWMPIDVDIQTTAGVERFVIWDSLETQVFHLHVNELPQSVELDPDNWVLNKAKDITGISSNPGYELDILAKPNPFSKAVEISYTLPTSLQVSLVIYNGLGQQKANLVDDNIPAGKHSVTWNAEGNAPGIYLYRIKFGDHTQSGKLILSEY